MWWRGLRHSGTHDAEESGGFAGRDEAKASHQGKEKMGAFNFTPAFVMVVRGLSAAPEFISCAAGDYQAQPVVLFVPNHAVNAGTIVIPNICGLPGPPYNPWQSPPYFWTVTSAGNLGNNLPNFGESFDGGHFSTLATLRFTLPPGPAPGD